MCHDGQRIYLIFDERDATLIYSENKVIFFGGISLTAAHNNETATLCSGGHVQYKVDQRGEPVTYLDILRSNRNTC